MQKIWLGLLLAICALQSCTQTKKPLDPSQETAFFYLYNQTLITDTFSRTLYQDAIDFVAVDQEKGLLYFIFDKTMNRDATLLKIARDTSLIEFAPCENGPCNFGGLEGNVDDIYALRMPITNLRVDSQMSFPFVTKTTVDTMTFAQLQKSLDKSWYYGGKEYFVIGKNNFRNLGVSILKKNEDSKIYALAQKLKGDETEKEKIVQNVLDLVANEIEYSYADFWYQTEIMQRAHEVLLSGFADCSGKTVLMASLLEQLDIEYVLLYYKSHVNIAIAGDFPNDNGYEVPINGQQYTIAETTCPNFKMGRTLLEKNIVPTIIYYQNPQADGQIYDYLSEKKMKLYSQEEMDEMMGY